MNGSTDANAALLDGIIAGAPVTDGVDVLVCPPYPYLDAVRSRLEGTGIALGAQNVSQHESGAYTGEVSCSMLQDAGCRYVIVGHSERRAMMGETSAIVAEKFIAADAAGLVPILCVGETLDEREAGRTEAVIDGQLDAVLDVAGIDAIGRGVIAYEPVWAIGTGKTATPEQAEAVHRHSRGRRGAADAGGGKRTRVVYGCGGTGSDAAGLCAGPDIDGGLIGGASLKADEFLAIAKAAATRN